MTVQGGAGPPSQLSTALRKYAPLVLGVPGTLGAGWFELSRALAGREVAWLYAVEWPLYGVLGVLMWWRVWGSASAEPGSTGSAADRSATDGPGLLPRTAGTETPTSDPDLAAWQRYLSALQAADPPGGPPGRH